MEMLGTYSAGELLLPLSRVTEVLQKRCRPASVAATGSAFWRVSPSANGEQRLHLPVLLLEQIELLDAAVRVLPLVVPRVPGVVFLEVGVRV